MKKITIFYSLFIFSTIFLFLVPSVTPKAHADWNLVDSPNATASTSGVLNTIQGMANTSANDIWAVGVNFDNNSSNRWT